MSLCLSDNSFFNVNRENVNKPSECFNFLFVLTVRIGRQNVPRTKRPTDKTSGTKCPKGQIVLRDKMSQGDKWGPLSNTPANYLIQYDQDKGMTERNLPKIRITPVHKLNSLPNILYMWPITYYLLRLCWMYCFGCFCCVWCWCVCSCFLTFSTFAAEVLFLCVPGLCGFLTFSTFAAEVLFLCVSGLCGCCSGCCCCKCLSYECLY